MSARLRDGSMLWFFGDTAVFGLGGELKYFEVGSAGWSPPGQPTVTLDYTAGSQPVPFAEPTDAFPDCPAQSENSGMWPNAAVVEAVGSRDRVIVWMTNICLGPGPTAVGKGVSVGEFWYDPADPPAGKPVRLTILNQNLFESSGYGTAAVLDGGKVYAYGCDVPDEPTYPSAYGPCRVARVEPSRVSDPDAYEPWSGREWIRRTDPEVLDLLWSGGERSFAPPGPFSVDRLGDTGLFAMVYSPWPGYSDRFEIRVAVSPQGPWSSPAVGRLPNCEDASDEGVVGRCYAANLQPTFDEPGAIGIGYYDQIVSTDPPHGSFLVTAVPFEVTSGG